jgi:hypothetical protein
MTRRRATKRHSIASIPQGAANDDRPDVAATESTKRRSGVSAEAGGDIGADDDKPTAVHRRTPEETNGIENGIKDIIVFQGCSQDQLDTRILAMVAAAQECRRDSYSAGREEGGFFDIADQGEDDLFIRKGTAEATKVGSIQPRGFSSELALMHSQPQSRRRRSASCAHSIA